MTSYKHYIVLLLILAESLICFGQQNSGVIAKILVTEEDNLINITGQAENETVLFKDELFYNLVALKRSATGNYSNNKQAGDFSLEPNQKKILSKVKLDITEGEEIRVFLFIKHRDILVAKDSLLILPPNSVDVSEEIIDESEFEIKGIVIDNAITKMGKDFHDYFYQSYITSGTQYPFIITIKEKPSFGRSSIITVEVDEVKINEFQSMPDEDYLRMAVETTLRNLNTYSIQRKLLYKNTRI